MTVRLLAYYAIVGTVTAVAATLAPIPYMGTPAAPVAVIDAVIVTGWATHTAITTRVRGGRS